MVDLLHILFTAAILLAPSGLFATWSLCCLWHSRVPSIKRGLSLVLSAILAPVLAIICAILATMGLPMGNMFAPMAGATFGWTIVTMVVLTSISGSRVVMWSTIAAGAGALVVSAPLASTRLAEYLTFGLPVLALLAWNLIAFLGFAHWAMQMRLDKAYLCESCGYDIRHLEADVCPECGAHFDRLSVRISTVKKAYGE